MDFSTVSDTHNLSNIISNCSMSKVTFRPKAAKRSLIKIEEGIGEEETVDLVSPDIEILEKTDVDDHFPKQRHKKLKLTILDSAENSKNITNHSIQNTVVGITENELPKIMVQKSKLKNSPPSGEEQVGMDETFPQQGVNHSLESAYSFINENQSHGMSLDKKNRVKKKPRKRLVLANIREEHDIIKNGKCHKENDSICHTTSDNLYSSNCHSNLTQSNRLKIKRSKSSGNNAFVTSLNDYKTEFFDETPLKIEKERNKRKSIYGDLQKEFSNITDTGLLHYAESTPLYCGINSYKNKPKYSPNEFFLVINDNESCTKQIGKHKNKVLDESEISLVPEINRQIKVKKETKSIDPSNKIIDYSETTESTNNLQTNISECNDQNKTLVSHKKHSGKTKSRQKDKVNNLNTISVSGNEQSDIIECNNQNTIVSDKTKSLHKDTANNISSISVPENEQTDIDEYNNQNTTVVSHKKLSGKRKSRHKDKANNINSSAQESEKMNIKRNVGDFELNAIGKKSKKKVKLVCNDGVEDNLSKNYLINDVKEKDIYFQVKSRNNKHSKLNDTNCKIRQKSDEIDIRKELILKALESISDSSRSQSSKVVKMNTNKRNKIDKIKSQKSRQSSNAFEKVHSFKTSMNNKHIVNNYSGELGKPKLKAKKKKKSNEIEMIRKQLISNAFKSFSFSMTTEDSVEKPNKDNIVEDDLLKKNKKKNKQGDNLNKDKVKKNHKTKVVKKESNEIDIIRKQLISNALVSISGSSGSNKRL